MDKWLERNREHLEEQDRRRKLKEEKAEEEKDKPKRKIPNRKKREPIVAETHIEAIQQVLEVRNYQLMRVLSMQMYDCYRRRSSRRKSTGKCLMSDIGDLKLSWGFESGLTLA